MLTGQIIKLYQRVQKVHPLVHCLSNIVTANDCANLLLAAGASPTMAAHPKESAEITMASKSLVCNLGAVKDYEAIMNSAIAANHKGIPVIIDPVGIGGSTYRRSFLFELLKQLDAPIIRGNSSEILALMLQQATVAGVDASTQILSGQYEELVEFARCKSCTLIVSGKEDLITDGSVLYKVLNGDPMMTRITGTGCMSSALLGAYYGVVKEKEESLLAAVASCVVMGISGELAKEETVRVSGGTMSFHHALIDRISLLNEDEIRSRSKIIRHCF